jgi:bacillithiol system protein YtxJ
MNWISLSDTAQLDTLVEQSWTTPQVIFKHSTRCSISSTAKNRLDTARETGSIPFYYLDLITYRSLSNLVAERFEVPHESPQILVIKNGKCVYDESHLGIRMEDILELAA